MREEKRAGKMREAGEYVDGIFHESIMAIQSGRGRRGTGWDGAVQRGARICRFDANVGMRFIRALSDVLHPSRRNSPCFLSVSG